MMMPKRGGVPMRCGSGRVPGWFIPGGRSLTRNHSNVRDTTLARPSELAIMQHDHAALLVHPGMQCRVGPPAAGPSTSGTALPAPA